jgi:hypothetical protein
MKMARIFQQCTNCFEKGPSIDTAAELVYSFGTFVLNKKGVENF